MGAGATRFNGLPIMIRGGGILGTTMRIIAALALLMMTVSAPVAAQERESAQVSLFGDATVEIEDPDLDYCAPWAEMEQLDHELGAVGFYLGGHPLDSYPAVLAKVVLAERLEELSSGNYTVAGVVRKRQERVSKRGKRFAYVEMSDPTGDFEVLVSENILTPHRDKMTSGNLIRMRVKAERNEGETRLFADGVELIDASAAGEKAAKPVPPKGLKIRLRQANIETLDELQAMLENLRAAPHQMTGYIEIIAPIGNAREAAWRLDGKWGIDPKIRKAIKANRAVETIQEIVA